MTPVCTKRTICTLKKPKTPVGFQHCLGITEPHSGPAKHHEIGLKIKMQLTADSCFSLLLLEAD